jgi:translation elongation factor EF-G
LTTAWRSSRSSTRSICRARSRRGQAADRGDRRARCERRDPGEREGRDRRPRDPRGDRAAAAAAEGDPDAPLKALIFDSWYDAYRGVIILTRVIDGAIRPGMKIRLMAKGQEYTSIRSACSRPSRRGGSLGVGEVGFIFAGIKTVSDAQIGDTITEASRPTSEPFRASR